MVRCTCNLHPLRPNDTKPAMKLHAFSADNAEGRLTLRGTIALLNSRSDPVFRTANIRQRDRYPRLPALMKIAGTYFTAIVEILPKFRFAQLSTHIARTLDLHYSNVTVITIVRRKFVGIDRVNSCRFPEFRTV